jgi:diadenylate cyclase
LIEMQLEDSVMGVMADRAALVRDYTTLDAENEVERVLAELGGLEHTELLDFGRLAELLGYDRKTDTLEYAVAPRGYRVLSGVPRLPRLIAQKVVNHFGDLEGLTSASDVDLELVDGVGAARAREIREGIRRLQEVDIVDRYR